MQHDFGHSCLTAFEKHLTSEERSRATIEKYRRDVLKFFSFGAASKLDFGKEMLIAYKEELARSYAVSSVNSMLAAVNSLLHFIGRDEWCVKPLKLQRRVFCPQDAEMSRGEYLALLDMARRKKKERLWLLLQTLCSTGIRVGELGFITVEAARQRRAEVSCKGKSRLVFLPEKLCRALLDYCKKRGIRSGKIFVTKGGKPLDRSNIWHEMKQLCALAGVSPGKVFPHNLRHLFARTYYHQEKDLARLADLLGHSSVETTRIYILSTGEEQERQVESLGLLAS